jgi:outer membrane protein TolC
MAFLRTMNFRLLAASMTFLMAGQLLADAGQPDEISLSRAVLMAQETDPWLQGSLLEEQALQAQSTSAGTFPDPMVSVGFANLPTDTFDFNQEPMTQFRVGLSQRFPRGDSLALESGRLALMGSRQPALREDRKARVAVNVAALWLDSFLARETIRLIENDRSLFEYLVEVAQSNYATALGGTRQQDIVRAQLELTQLENRLTLLHQQHDTANRKLGEWLGPSYPTGDTVSWQQATVSTRLVFTADLPIIELREAAALESGAALGDELLGRYLLTHPAIRGLENKIEVERVGIAIAEQSYKPQWGLNASYGYRDDEPAGSDRADFFSVAVTFDLPLFTGNRQDQNVQSAVAKTEAKRTEKWLLLRQMRAGLETQHAQLLRLNQRRTLYGDRLLEQMQEQAEASLSAYTSDDGDFSEVVRARIAELNAKIEALDIDVQRAKTIIQLNYFLIGDSGSEDTKTGAAS